MATEFMKQANLGRIYDYIRGEFIQHINMEKQLRKEARNKVALDLLSDSKWHNKHKKLFEWIEENPDVRISIADMWNGGTFTQKLAEFDSYRMVPMINDDVPIDKDSVIAYLNFAMPTNRNEAVKLVLDKYFTKWPGFIQSFKYV